MSRQFVHGWNPDSDAKKIKDYNARPLLNRVSDRPATATLRHLILSILNQGDLGSCVTQAVAQAWRMALVRAGLINAELLARLFLYYYARAMSPGDTQQDTGTEIRCAFDVIRKIGCCSEKFWEYDISKFAFMPGADAIRAAYDQKVDVGYYRIISTGAARIEDICTAIAGGHAVLFGTRVSAAIFDAKVDKPLGPPIGETIVGGHAMAVVGYAPGIAYESVNFDVVNSWGPESNTDGFLTMTDTYLAWSETRDLWIIEHPPLFLA
jgi:hypothetical protein